MSKWHISGFADEMSPELGIQLRELNRLGVGYMEPRTVDGCNISDLSQEQLAQMKSALAAAGVKVSSIGSPLGKISVEEDLGPHMEKLKRTLEIQKELDAPYVRMFSFYIPNGREPGEFRGQVLDRLGQMAEEAAKWDGILLHENEKGIYGDTAPRCLDLMEQLGSPHFRAVFDFANFVEVGQDTSEAFRLMRPYIRYIHIKDAETLPEGKKRIVPAGQGEGHVAEILQKLHTGGWEGFLSLEPHLVDFSGLAALEQDPQKRETKLEPVEAWELALSSLRDILTQIGVQEA